ncbi:MAG: hypothetical protein ABL962_10430 [Fimbriimonadaceae bacterium]
MTDQEKLHFQEVHKQAQIGYLLADRERYLALKDVNTVEAIASLMPAFEMAAKLPARSTSGLVAFYAALMKTK